MVYYIHGITFTLTKEEHDIANIIDFSSYRKDDKVITPSSLTTPSRTLASGLIAPAIEDTSYRIAGEHTSGPIKSLDDIDRVSRWYIARGRYRDNMLFIVGINFGLRVSDLLTLRFSHLIDDSLCFKTTFPILEKKTEHTRKTPKNRYITINDAVVEAVTLYLEHTPGVHLSDYMFRSESNRGKNLNQPINRNSVERVLKEAASDLHLGIHVATHTLRKTFAYHQMVMSGNDPRKLLLLQKMFGHSTSAQTLDYIGITLEEIEDAYKKLNLGSRHHYLIDSKIGEERTDLVSATA